MSPPTPADHERLVTLVLCDPSGRVLGQLPSFTCGPQFWPEVEDVVSVARSRLNVDVTILRLLTTENRYAGGAVSYLAQLAPGSPTSALAAVSTEAGAALDGDPAHRMWWAEPGALDDLTDWLDTAPTGHGSTRNGPLRRRRTWNLSCVLTTATTSGSVWFKAVPPFLADEGGVMARVARVDVHLTPVVLAHDPTRRAILIRHAPGEDQWGLADVDVIGEMLERRVGAQAALVDDVGHLLAVGVADGRPDAITAGVRSTLDAPGTRASLSVGEVDALAAMADALPRLLAEIEACGLPDTLCHGDLHPGNWRRAGRVLTLLDWGDSRIGNPALDVRAFVERLTDPAQQEWARSSWAQAWRRRVPGCEPERALTLVAPVSELCAAVTYQRFLDHVEQTERAYHRHDPVAHLRAALAVSR